MVEWTGKPAYQQVADDLQERIANGEFSESRKLPSLAELRATYGATATVARDAIRQLRSDGLAISHQGKGAYLTDDAVTVARASDSGRAVTGLREEVTQLRGELNELRNRVAALESD